MNYFEKKFLQAIAKVCRAHGVTLESGDNYDENERFAGTEFYFTGKHIERMELDIIQQKIKELKGKKIARGR